MTELRQLTPDDEKQVLGVWKTCFNDSEDFLETYFQSSMDIRDGLGFFDDSGRLVSNLFVRELAALVSGTVYTAGFIAGCATLPDARRQNLMSRLLRTALTDMRVRNIPVCYLHPFLHSFYRKFGFETISYVRTAVADAANVDRRVRTAIRFDPVLAASMFASYQEYVSSFSSSFVRSKDRMNAWLQLLFADGGKAAYLDGSQNTPYALYYETKDEQGNPVADIFELVYFSDSDLQALTEGLGITARFFLPAARTGSNVDEFTMMRVVRPEIMLENYPFAEGTKAFVINIHDSFLETDLNLAVAPRQGGAIVREMEAPADIVVDIRELPQLLCGSFDPNVMTAASHFFRLGTGCYFETY